MGSKNIDRITPIEWRSTADAVEEMIAKGWSVVSRCHVCGLIMPTNLKLIARVSGPGVSLWNRREKCRRLGCTGFVDFLGHPPGLHQHFPLRAEWPPSRKPNR